MDIEDVSQDKCKEYGEKCRDKALKDSFLKTRTEQLLKAAKKLEERTKEIQELMHLQTPKMERS